ncbi:DNA-binding MarR family transcriptional regulator [Sphingobium sp. B11D3D]|nr:DNA-binding MarR family transcriptional regulator [Sphingobium sp. B12D2B]MCW2371001.1 DNA-binding MarR family transcriptional regulator [Sphingobium sp. B11D3D]
MSIKDCLSPELSFLRRDAAQSVVRRHIWHLSRSLQPEEANFSSSDKAYARPLPSFRRIGVGRALRYRHGMSLDIASSTLRALRRILRATEIGSRQLATATGLTPSQLLVLREIAAASSATPSAIAQSLQFSQATITAIVDRLVALGFVQRERSERDKRQFHLHVLAAGETALSEAPDPLQATFTERFSALPVWEQAMVLAATERLAMLMDAEHIDAAPLLDSGPIDRARPHSS